MSKKKVSDMNKEFVITFLQEYSYYVKKFRSGHKNSAYDIMCPTEFFNKKFLQILKDTDRTKEAFKSDNDAELDLMDNIITEINEQN